MQLILDEIHALQKDWESQDTGEWAEASIINSSKVLVVTVCPCSLFSVPGYALIREGDEWSRGQYCGSAPRDEPRHPSIGREHAVSVKTAWHHLVYANVHRCPYNTRLMSHAEPHLQKFVDRVSFRPATENVTILDPMSTEPVSSPRQLTSIPVASS